MSRNKRAKGERGAALVEAALITPVFLLLLFGVFEWSYAFLDRLTIKNASLSAARVASSEGLNGSADYNILQTAKRSSAAIRSGQVQLVVVYEASSYSASVPAGCLTASQVGSCNRYTGSDFNAPLSSFGCGTGKLDNAYCPTTMRKVAQGGPNGPPDYVGVYIQGLHNNVTGLFGESVTFKSDTVIRLEPARLG